jgi:predicted neuraminidase
MSDTNRPDRALAVIPPNFSPGPSHHSTAVKFQGIPGIDRTEDGRIYATWYAGGVSEGPDNYVLLVRSDDDGRTWTEPLLVIDPPGDVRAFDPCIWVDPLGRLWLFYAQSISWYDGRAGVWFIRCDRPGEPGAAWTSPRRIAHGIALNKPTITRTGVWLLPAALWKFNQPCHTGLETQRMANVIASTDQGETWTRIGGADVPDSAFDEPMIVERRDGTLWMLVRTVYGIGESLSRDGGRTWSPGANSGLGGPNARFFIRRLRSGRILLVNHTRQKPLAPGDPSFRLRNNLTAMLSDDDGRSWSGHLMIDHRHGVSYPDGFQTADGRITIIYDHHRQTYREILMAVFTEDDVLRGEWASPAARQRIVISKGCG